MYSLIPFPQSVQIEDGTLNITDLKDLTVNAPDLVRVADQFRDELSLWSGMSLPAARVVSERAAGSVHAELVGTAGNEGALSPDSGTARGAHTLIVDQQGILVRATSPEGIYRGLTSVIQILATSQNTVNFAHIEDEARYGWRGLSLDVARNFSPLPEVKRVIDVLALYKFDVLHLHLSDNEGWRLQIPSWPHLTPEPTDGDREYFTVSEFEELIEYASARFVTVIPEIDMPGHVGAAIRAYPELNRAAVGSLDSLFPSANLAADSAPAWQFVDDVLALVAQVTAGPYLHIGGDEAFGMDDDAHEAFVNHAITTAEKLGKRIVGWQETSRANVNPDHITQHWIDFSHTVQQNENSSSTEAVSMDDQSAATGIPAATLEMLRENFLKAVDDVDRTITKGARVLMSPTSNAYLDRPHADSSNDPIQEAGRDQLGLAFYPPTELAAYFDWDPETINGAIPANRIVGVEAALWTESANTPEKRGALLLPRLPAIAEVGWSQKSGRDWDDYRQRLATHAQLWDRAGLAWYQAASIDWVKSAHQLPVGSA